jgi:hypothetical protein
LPDVYILILDGYGRDDVLRERYAFENDLVPRLRELGFSVSNEAASNYAQTALSLASALNLDYLQSILGAGNVETAKRGTLARLISNNRFFEAFAAAGYRVTAYRSEYELLRPGPVHQRRGPFGFVDSFGYGTYEMTVVPPMLQMFGLPRGWLPARAHRRQVLWTLEDLATVGRDQPGPHLVFAHVLAPHPPFVFNGDGSARATALPFLLNDGDHWRNLARGTGERYEAGYVMNLRFLNAQILSTVRRLLAAATRPTIIYIQGDHGPGAGLSWEDANASDMRERHGILMAMRTPQGSAGQPLPSGTTPVNAFRLLASQALRTSFPRLEDRSYFQTWMKPFRFIDVTDRVRRGASIDGAGRERQWEQSPDHSASRNTAEGQRLTIRP